MLMSFNSTRSSVGVPFFAPCAEPCLRRCAPGWLSSDPGIASATGGTAAGGGTVGGGRRSRGRSGRLAPRAVRRGLGSAAGLPSAAGFGLAADFAWPALGFGRIWLSARLRFGSRFAALAFGRRCRGGRFRGSLGRVVRLFRGFYGGAFAGGCLFGGLFGLFLRQVVAYRGLKCCRYCLPNFPHSPAV